MTEQTQSPLQVLDGIRLTPTVATSGPESTVIEFVLENPALGERTAIHIRHTEGETGYAYGYQLNEGRWIDGYDTPYGALTAAISVSL